LPRIFIILLSFILSGCASGNQSNLIYPSSVGSTLTLPQEKAALVVGITVQNPAFDQTIWKNALYSELGLVSVDPRTGYRVGSGMPFINTGCSILLTCYVNRGEAVQYQVYVVDPGTYALGWVWLMGAGKSVAQAMHFREVTVSYADNMIDASLDARLLASTPIVTAAPGEVVFAGDLVLDYGREGWVGWSIRQDDAGALDYLKRTGLAGRMVSRPMRRTDGFPMLPTDGAVMAMPRLKR
jgi:hypothetical protein